MDRKQQRRLDKSVQLLRRHEPTVTLSLELTNHLYVANGGIVCGTTADELLSIFEVYGSVHVYQKPAKPYAFVSFENKQQSASAFVNLQGKRPKNDIVFYLSYIEQVPQCRSPVSALPEGLHLLEDFVSTSEEDVLWNLIKSRLFAEQLGIDAGDPSNISSESLKKRRVLHFGYNFVYGSNSVDVDGPFPQPIPSECNDFIDRLMQTGFITHRPDQLTVNIYEPGQGIPSHTDTHSCFQDSVISLSLLSPVMMDFVDVVSNDRVSVYLPERSVAIMTGPSRYVYKHSIASRKLDRLESGEIIRRRTRCSFTFRAIRKKPCECDYPLVCDWPRPLNNGDMRIPDSDKDAADLETTHVTQVYNTIATHFDATRHSRWPGVTSFLQTLPPLSFIIDVGCGNGKYLFPAPGHVKIGCDVSINLCEVSASKEHSVFVGQGLCLPLKDASFDAALSIAVIHHFATQKAQLQDAFKMECLYKNEAIRRLYQWLYTQPLSLYPAAKPDNNAMTKTFMMQMLESDKHGDLESATRMEAISKRHENRIKTMKIQLKVEQETQRVLSYKMDMVDGKLIEARLYQMINQS